MPLRAIFGKVSSSRDIAISISRDMTIFAPVQPMVAPEKPTIALEYPTIAPEKIYSALSITELAYTN